MPCPAKYTIRSKIPQFTGPWEDLTVKFVFRGYGVLELQVLERRKMEAIKRIAGKNQAGSPTGLLIYEGNLLPPQYRGQPIHTEAGKRVVNSYAIESAGAKYVFCGKTPQFTGPFNR